MKTWNDKILSINGRPIGQGHPAYVIAELSANHNRDITEAVKLIQAAKEAGADAVKLQTYTPDTITIDCQRPEFMIGGGTIWDGRGLYQLYQEAYTPWEWHPQLQKAALEAGIDLFSTPFDDTAVDFLEKLEMPAYKVASFELVDMPLLRRIARTGKPVICSTGMASLAEIDEAVRIFEDCGVRDLALLKTNSAYPAPPEEMNLKTIAHLAEAFGVVAGLSDHTLGIAVPVAAVALGARVIEKHLTISRSVPGPDSAFSLEPEEFKQMVSAIRVAEKAIGNVSYEVTPKQAASRKLRRSLFVVADMKEGDVFTLENLRSIRPGHGLHTRFLPEILGRKAKHDIERGTPLAWSLVD